MSESDRPIPVAAPEHEARRVALRMSVPAVATSVLLLVVGILAASYLLRTQRQAAEVLDVEVASIRAAEEMAVTVREAEIQIHRFLVTGDSGNLEPLSELERRSDRWLERIWELARSDQERAIIKTLEDGQLEFWSEVVAQHRSQVANLGALYDRSDDLTSALNRYVATMNRAVHQASERNQLISRRLAVSLLTLGTLGSVLGLVLGFDLARRLRRSIVQLSLSIRDTAGKLDEVLDPITIASGPGGDALEESLQAVSVKVGAVVERLVASQRDHMRAEQLASLGRVSAGLAHELRNPIASMKLLIQSALERGTPLGERHLIVIRDEIERLERLAKTFLDFARPPSVERNRFDLVRVFEQKLLLVSGRLKLKRLAVESEIPEAPLPVDADQGQVRQLLLNLLLNAIDASPERGTIYVRITRSDAPPGVEGVDPGPGGGRAPRRWILIEVADRGPGLPPVTMEVLFAPFFSTKQEGMGLGLPISKQIVEAHGGRILAMDRPDGGADFRVLLPIAG